MMHTHNILKVNYRPTYVFDAKDPSVVIMGNLLHTIPGGSVRGGTNSWPGVGLLEVVHINMLHDHNVHLY